MTKISRDIPMHEGRTIADRLKAARLDANLTRKALSEATGIPASTIDKYERGDMDPNTTRLKTICDRLGVSVDRVINDDGAPRVSETSETAETQVSANVAETFTETVSETSPLSTVDEVSALLEEIDGLRSDNFEAGRRRAMALVNDVTAKLKYLEPGELIQVASGRGLYEGECPTTAFLDGLFQEKPDEAQEYCGNIEERILDTAILGVDLFTIQEKVLVKVAEQHKIESNGITFWDDWGSYQDFVPLMRPVFRSLSFAGSAVDFDNQDAFPRRE